MSSMSMSAPSYKLSNEFNNISKASSDILNNTVNTLNEAVENTVESVNNTLKNIVKEAPLSTSNEATIYWLYIIIVILLLALVGFNIFYIFGRVTDETIENAGPVMREIYSFFGYTVGNTASQTANTTGKGVKLGVDVAAGTIKTSATALQRVATNSMGDYYKGNEERNRVKDTHLINNMRYKNQTNNNVTANESANGVGRKFCRIDRGYCTTVEDSEKCLSGNIFTTMNACLKR
jgi:uncharacterized protein (DUF697 family)